MTTPSLDPRPPAAAECPGLLMLLGCTAVGKSDVALLAAQQMNAEIVCVDSMQVYRRMDIGTAKPTLEMRQRAQHHLLDLVEPSESFTVARFVAHADDAIADIRSRGRQPLAVAGTPFYLMALLFGLFEGPAADYAFRRAIRERAAQGGTSVLHDELKALDPEAATRIHPNDLHRIERALEVHHHTGQPISALQRQWDGPPRFHVRGVGLRRQRDDNSHRINTRVRNMLREGLVDEVRRLLAEPAGLSQQAQAALGYAEIIAHVRGQSTLEEAVEQIKINTRRFAKSQRTWFQRFRDVNWIDVPPDESPDAIGQRVVNVFQARP